MSNLYPLLAVQPITALDRAWIGEHIPAHHTHKVTSNGAQLATGDLEACTAFMGTLQYLPAFTA